MKHILFLCYDHHAQDWQSYILHTVIREVTKQLSYDEQVLRIQNKKNHLGIFIWIYISSSHSSLNT